MSRLFEMSAWIFTPKSNNGERMAVCNQIWCELDSSNNLFLQVAIKHNQSRRGLKENSGPSGVPLGNFPSADTIHWVYLYSSLFISHDSHEAVHRLYKVQKESNSVERSKDKISCGKGWSRKSALPSVSSMPSSKHIHVLINFGKISVRVTYNCLFSTGKLHLVWNSHKRTLNM